MRSVTLVLMLVVGFCMVGCETTKMTWNQQHMLAVGVGANVVVPVLDYTDTTKAQVSEFTTALIAFIDKGDISKKMLRDEAAVIAAKLHIEKYENYIDAIIAVLPSSTDLNEKIPEEYRSLLLSALRDGALYGVKLYNDDHVPAAEEVE